MKGTVKKLVEDRGYGFIHGEDGKDYFFHRDDFLGYFSDLMIDVNDGKMIQVQFNSRKDSKRGPRAENVERLDYPNQVA